jgi:hypothetical protein
MKVRKFKALVRFLYTPTDGTWSSQQRNYTFKRRESAHFDGCDEKPWQSDPGKQLPPIPAIIVMCLSSMHRLRKCQAGTPGEKKREISG